MDKSSTQNSITIKRIALMANVSLMTVSRVLNGSPNVASKTRQRVEAVIKQHGYQPDPNIKRLMARVRASKKTATKASIAVVRDIITNDHYRYVPLSAIVSRAKQHGYSVEEFFLGENKLTTKRLHDILNARGIEAIIASPPSVIQYLPSFNFKDYACVTFGYGLREPELHRVSTNMMQGIIGALNYLEAKGHKRIGIAITEWIDRRADYTYSGALLHFQQSIPKKNTIPLLYLPNEAVSSGKRAFTSWFKANKPDAVISLEKVIPEWIKNDLKLKIGTDVGFMVHDWTPELSGLSGIDHRREEVAKAAVDMLANQLMHNEKGVPDVPHQILIPPKIISDLHTA